MHRYCDGASEALLTKVHEILFETMCQEIVFVYVYLRLLHK